MFFHNLFILLALVFTTSTFAKECFTVNNENIVVSWTAFKTPKKVGVGGSFPNVTYTGKKTTAESIKTLIRGASVTIDGGKVETKNASRNKKIADYFFGNMMKGTDIKAKVIKLSKDMLTMDLTMNGITKKVPMSYVIDNNILKANGFMDVLDFSMSKSLKAINKACYALHEGKTWSDVELSLEVKFPKCS